MINTSTSNIANYGNKLNSILGTENITAEGLIEQLMEYDDSLSNARLAECIHNFSLSNMLNISEAQIVNDALQTLKQ